MLTRTRIRPGAPAHAVTLAMALALTLALVLGLVVGLSGCGPDAASTGVSPDGRPLAVADRGAAPALRGDLLGGGRFELADHSGDVVVVNFWASWCAPCVVEADDLEQTYQATKADGVTFVGVNTRDERDAASRFPVGRSTYPSIFDPAGQVALRFSVPPTAIPSTILLDRRGRVALVVPGAVVRGFLEPLVKQLAAERL